MGKVDVILHVVATLAAVIALAQVLGRLLKACGQPAVIGEMLAGILLGPSALGAVFPQATRFLIPPPDIDLHAHVPAALGAIAQLGIILYMFLIGLELNSPDVRSRAKQVTIISLASIAIPFALGAGLGTFLYPVFANPETPRIGFVLFIGVTMSVTAFPVLARILADRGMEKTNVGTLALVCAAMGDVLAWCLLAVVIGIARAEVDHAIAVILEAFAFIIVVTLLIRPVVVRMTQRLNNTPGPLSSGVLAISFFVVLVASLTTEAIGIHAIFGSFLVGLIVPHDSKLARDFTLKLKDTVVVLFLPAFFAITGLRMQLNLIHGSENWLWASIIVMVAVAGKFGGAMLSALITGLSWRDSATIGILMNTRGLMELIVLNIGLEMKLISPALFAILVIMAIFTTAITSPLLSLISPKTQPVALN